MTKAKTKGAKARLIEQEIERLAKTSPAQTMDLGATITRKACLEALRKAEGNAVVREVVPQAIRDALIEMERHFTTVQYGASAAYLIGVELGHDGSQADSRAVIFCAQQIEDASDALRAIHERIFDIVRATKGGAA